MSAATSRPGALKGMLTSRSENSSSCMRSNSCSSDSSKCNYITDDDTCDKKSSLKTNTNAAAAVAGGANMTVASDRMLIEGNLLDRQTGQGLTSFFDLKMNTAFASRCSSSINSRIVGFEYEYCIYSLQFGNFKLNLSSGMTIMPSFHEIKALQEKRTKGDDFSISIVIPSRTGSKTKRNVLILRPYSLSMYIRWHKLLRESIIETCFHEVFQFLMGENNKLDYASFMNLVDIAIANCKELGEDTNQYLLRLKYIWNTLVEIQEIVEIFNKYNSKDENDKDPYSVLVEEIDDILKRTQKEPMFELHGQVHMIRSFYDYIIMERERKASNSSFINLPTTPTLSMDGSIQKPKALSSTVPNKKSFFRRPTAEIAQSASPSLSPFPSDTTNQLINGSGVKPFLNPNHNHNHNGPIKTPIKDSNTPIVSIKHSSTNIHANNTSGSGSGSSNFNSNSSNSSSNTNNSNFTNSSNSNMNSSTQTSGIPLTGAYTQEMEVKFYEDSENIHPNSPNKTGYTKPPSVFLNTSLLISKPLSTEGSAARLENPLQIASRPARPPLKKLSQFESQDAPVDIAGSSKAAGYFEKIAIAFKRSDNNPNPNPNPNPTPNIDSYPNGSTLTYTANSSSKSSSPIASNEPVVIKSCSVVTATIDTANTADNTANTSISRVRVSGDINNVNINCNNDAIKSSTKSSSTKASPEIEERMICPVPTKLVQTSSSVTASNKIEHLGKKEISKNETSTSLKDLKKNLLNDFNDNMLNINAKRSKVVSVLMSRSNQTKSFTPIKASSRLLGLEEGVFRALLGQFSGSGSSKADFLSNYQMLDNKSYASPMPTKTLTKICDMIPSRSLVLFYRQEIKKYQQFKVLMFISLFILHCYRYRQAGVNNNHIKIDNNLLLYMWSILIKRRSRKTNTSI